MCLSVFIDFKYKEFLLYFYEGMCDGVFQEMQLQNLCIEQIRT